MFYVLFNFDYTLATVAIKFLLKIRQPLVYSLISIKFIITAPQSMKSLVSPCDFRFLFTQGYFHTHFIHNNHLHLWRIDTICNSHNVQYTFSVFYTITDTEHH